MIEDCFSITTEKNRKINLGNEFSISVHGKKKKIKPIKISLRKSGIFSRRDERYATGTSSLEEAHDILTEIPNWKNRAVEYIRQKTRDY